MLRYSVEQARRSELSAFPFRVYYIDYRLIGTHEAQAPSAEKHVYDSMLEHGYDGPPIVVFQYGSDALFNEVDNDTQIKESYGVIGVADGHHRLKAMHLLGQAGLLKDHIIPVQLVPAHNPEFIRIGTLSDDEVPLPVEAIEACFTEQGKVIPLCTSHFRARLTTGEWVRLQQAQPNIKIEKASFIAAS